MEGFNSRSYSDQMLWPKLGEIKEAAEQADAVLVFAGTMVSEDTEMFDRRTARLNPNFGMFIEEACRHNPNVVVVLQSGSALILDGWHQKTPAILEMWLGGEACGKAVAQIFVRRTESLRKACRNISLRGKKGPELSGKRKVHRVR